MPNVASGIEVGAAPPLDPFAAALESKGITGGGSSTTSSVSDGLTYGDQTPEPVAAPAAGDTSGDVTTGEEGEGADPLHEDPDIAAYLEKFDGDPDKALKAAAAAQALIGRQGNELGELRQTVAELKGAVDVLKTQPAQQQAQVQLTSEQLDEMYSEHGGLQLATWAANNAPHLVDNVLSMWGADEPFNATKFDREYSDWKKDEAAKTAIPSDPSRTEEYIQQQIEVERMNSSMADVGKEFENFDKFGEFLNTALDGAPRLIQEGVLSDDDEVQRDSLKIVFDRADRLYLASLGGTAAAEEAAKREAAKRNARVIRGSAGTPAPPTGGKDAEDIEAQRQKALKDAILGASTTSVRDGLTYGK